MFEGIVYESVKAGRPESVYMNQADTRLEILVKILSQGGGQIADEVRVIREGEYWRSLLAQSYYDSIHHSPFTAASIPLM